MPHASTLTPPHCAPSQANNAGSVVVGVADASTAGTIVTAGGAVVNTWNNAVWRWVGDTRGTCGGVCTVHAHIHPG